MKTLNKFKYEEEYPTSDCCGVDMPDWPDYDICPKCGEHTGIQDTDGLTPEEENAWLKSIGY